MFDLRGAMDSLVSSGAGTGETVFRWVDRERSDRLLVMSQGRHAFTSGKIP